MPKISVIMPVYNGEKYLREAIDSILNQTFSDFEFIIINDASKDSTEEIIKSYDDDRIVYLKNEQNLGVAGTLNRGLDIAKGEYIARMDADDISFSHRFQMQVDFLDNNKTVGVCGSNLRIFGERIDERDFFYPEYDESIRVDMIFNSAFAHPSIMMRRDIIEKYHIRYDIAFEKAEDYKMWHDILLVSEGYNIQEYLLKYRYHSSQVTKTCIAEKTSSVTKMRAIMYKTLAIHNDDYLELFAQICDGKRDFSENEYLDFLKLVELSKNSSYNKRELMNTWSAINRSIYQKSKIKNYKALTMRERLIALRGVLKK